MSIACGYFDPSCPIQYGLIARPLAAPSAQLLEKEGYSRFRRLVSQVAHPVRRPSTAP